jgi:hypothetical protein
MGTISDSLLDKHRDINVEGWDWWDYTFDHWIEKLLPLGIRTDATQMQFSGFWSQGDGASFTGEIDTKQFFDAHPELHKFTAAKHFIDMSAVSLRIVRGSMRGRWHSSACCVNLDLDFEPNDDEEDLRNAVHSVFYEQWLNAEGDDLETACNEIVRGYMDALYKDLEAEHEHLTSDEQVRETLEANEIFDDEEDEEEGEEKLAA